MQELLILESRFLLTIGLIESIILLLISTKLYILCKCIDKFSSYDQLIYRIDIMNELIVQPIGILHCDLINREHTPKNYDESKHVGTIEIYPEFLEGLDGVQKGDIIVVLFWLDRADRSILRVHPRGDKSKSKRGVFSTRSPVRPNPVAISELLVLDINENILTVKGLDILDSTPIIDIKKKIYAEENIKLLTGDNCQ